MRRSRPTRRAYGSEVLDASVLIMPLVFFAAPTDPRFISTLGADPAAPPRTAASCPTTSSSATTLRRARATG